MADEIRNVIFQVETRVKGDGTKQLASDFRSTDAETKKAQKTLDEFNARLTRNRQAAQAAAIENAKAAGSLKQFGSDAAKSTQQVATMTDTVAKAGKAFGTFVSISPNARGFLTPLIAQTDKLGAQARKTGGDMDFLKQKAAEAGRASVSGPTAPVPSAAPGAPAPNTTGPSQAVSGLTNETRQLAATLLLLGEEGQEVFDGLGTSIEQDAALLRELINVAAQTPAGAEALAQDLTDVQKAAIGTLESMGAITAEQKPLIEQAVKMKNAQTQVDGATKKTVQTYSSLRAQLRQAKAELDALIEASDGKMTPEIAAAAKRAGELEDRFEDLNATVAAFNPDKKFQALTGIIQNLAGGFTAVQGALALVGVEGQGVQEALLKVQGALAITQGLQALFGGLRDNLRNIRLLMVSSASAARGLAVAEGLAGKGAVAQSVATGGLSGALSVARAAVLRLWAAIAASPVGLWVAGISLFILTIYQMVKANEEALVSADKLTAALDRVAKAREFDRERDSTEAALEAEAKTLEKILQLEQQRSRIPSTASAEQKALANLLIDEQIAEVTRGAARQKALLEETTLTRAITDTREQRLEVEEALAAAYKKAHSEFIADEDINMRAALDSFEARQEMTEKETIAARNQAVLERNLSEDEVADVDKLLDKRDELIAAERDAASQINAVRLKSRNTEIQNQVDITKAMERERDARRALGGPLSGTIADLQRQQAALANQLNEQLRIGSPEFFETAAKYIEVTRAISDAQENLKGVDAFAAGSLNDLNQELAFLQNALRNLPGDAEGFEALSDAANDLKKQVEELEKRLAPKDPKELTARLLAELQEQERHALAVHDLDQRAAATRAQNENASEAELKAIDQRFQAERLRLMLDFELKRLEIMQRSGTATEQELTAQANRIKEIRSELALPPDTTTDDKGLQELLENIISVSDQIAQAGIRAWGAWTDAQAKSLDAQIAAQKDRVDEALQLADKGNSAVLAAEKERLQSLVDARRQAAEEMAGIAQAEAAAQAVVAIARAAAEGGGFLSVATIAATLIALTAGIAQARSIATAGVPSFFRGGKAQWSKLGGFTGHGDPRTASEAVGTKPYQYEHQEFVMDHATTMKGDNLREFTRILRDRVDIAAERRKMLTGFGRKNVDALMPSKMTVKIDRGSDAIATKEADRIVRAIENMPKTKVVMDEHGLTVMLRGKLADSEAVNARR